MKPTPRQKRAIIAVIKTLNNLYGAGEVRAIVFPIVPFAGVSQTSGMVVSQQQYGMRARYFKVVGRSVRYLRQSRVFEPKGAGK